MGRPKAARATTPVIAINVLRAQNAEKLWNEVIETEIGKMRANGNTAGLRETLKYLEDRAHGKCVENLNHMHDKPVELTGTFSISLSLKKARERVMQATERSV